MEKTMTGPFAIFKTIFGTNDLNNGDYSDIEIKDKELIEAMNKADRLGKTVETAIQVGNTESNGGFSKGIEAKIDTNTLNKMRKVAKEVKKDMEKGER